MTDFRIKIEYIKGEFPIRVYSKGAGGAVQYFRDCAELDSFIYQLKQASLDFQSGKKA